MSIDPELAAHPPTTAFIALLCFYLFHIHVFRVFINSNGPTYCEERVWG